MKIGLDIMGGDYAPNATVLGAIAAYPHLKENQHLVLFGNKDQITPI
ncbi:MAG: phosphate--acyl-ACP acyltransferase, partial [Bacteroidetes bacterium]|nr:phosphate--acyl-ACP acyltransferase [Bacteroidota bacterium]MBU1760133.1 phosphate--acyl-ACP acyltransferase [Bacteroidota bacterium]